MPAVRLVLSVVIALFLSLSTATPQSVTPGPQPLVFLQNSLAALSGGQSITDVTLTGTARRIAGSDDDIGTAVLKAMVSGESRVDLTLPSGQRSEIRANSPTGFTGSWVATDGTAHPISQHNLWTDSSWFFPPFTIARLLSDSSFTVSYAGNETNEGQAVEHLTVVRQFQASSVPLGWIPDTLQHLSAMDIYLDASTLLPSILRFNTHPDRNQTIDIAVEIRFSDYRQVGSVQTPFRIQKYLNNALAFDFQINAATLNTGLTAEVFRIQ